MTDRRAPVSIAVIIDEAADHEIGVRRVLDALASDDSFRISSIYIANTTSQKLSGLYRGYMALEQQLIARRRPFEALAWEKAREQTGDTPIDEIDAARDAVDVIVDLTSTAFDESNLGVARHGVWKLSSFAPTTGFYESLQRSAVTTVRLLQHRKDAPVSIIATANYSTKHFASRNAAFVREKSSQLLIRELRRLWFTNRVRNEGVYADDQRSPPGFINITRYVSRALHALAQRALIKFRAAIGRRPGMFYLRIGDGGPLDFDPQKGVDIIPDENRYWADPFLFEHENQTYVFFEDVDYATRKATISVGSIEGDEFALLGTALDTDYHLSYPFIFEHQSEIFMLPETCQAKRLEVWRCLEFPAKWERYATALDGTITADSVIFQKDGTWWLFSNITNDSYADHCSELHIFQVDGPALTSIVPHPLNPVVIDTQTARGAGRIFEHDGKLLRASQCNIFGTYGYGLNIMEITRLSLEDYDEQLLRRLEPEFESGLIGCHHADFLNGRYVIDPRKHIGGHARASS